MRSIKKQAGMTAIGWLIVLALVLGGFLLAITLIPMYIQSYEISSALKSLPEHEKVKGKTARDAITVFHKILSINQIRIPADDIKVARVANGYTVSVNHELRKSIVGNLHVVLVVKDSVTIPSTIR